MSRAKPSRAIPRGAFSPTSAGIPDQLRPPTSRNKTREASLAKPEAATAPPPPVFSFRHKPRDIARHLSRFVIGQTEAKKVLSVALCDHFQHVRLTMEGHEAPHYQKQNVLLLGPTGVGKTHLIRSAAELIGVPFVKADATKFSETGYVGGDVDDLVRDLVRRAGGDVRRASHGIIYLDEIDKLAGRGPGRDVSGRGVQTNLLKLLEDGDVPLVSPNDVSGQIEAAMSAARGSARGGPDAISTRNILFIASGAFSGLENIVKHRLEEISEPVSHLNTEKLLARANTSDLVRFGLEPEFVGRLPVRVVCHRLTASDLFSVLKKSESSLLHQYERAFAAYGIRLVFCDDALRLLASLACNEGTGARGLMTVLEKTFRDFKFQLPSSRVRRLDVTADVVRDPSAALAELLRRKS